MMIPSERQKAWLAIELFREDRPPFAPSEAPARVFRSSGTTSALRSRSWFSAEGIARCDGACLRSFETVLRLVGGEAPPRAGFSLVPPLESWPESSLANMIESFSVAHDIVWGTDAQLDAWVSRHTRPVWVFGTAAHFLPLIRASRRVGLPAGSLVIETGGMKGLTDAMTREELYAGLAEVFGIGTGQIISEYGMCELATPAWDYCPAGEAVPLEARRFRFPDWVRLGIMRGLSRVESTGRGALVVDDAERIDVQGPIRTQDMVELFEDQSFRLLGRVRQAPLKGCSLNVLVETPAVRPDRGVEAARSLEPWRLPSGELARARAELAREAILSFCEDPSSVTPLASEWSGTTVAAAAVEDLKASLPLDIPGWETSMRRAFGTVDSEALIEGPREWLLLPAASHPVVAVYPLVMAALAGLKVHIRMPAESVVEAFLSPLIQRLRERLDWDCEILPPSFRVGQDPLPLGVEGILAYGADETIESLRQWSGVPVRGFGSALAASVLDARTFEKDMSALARDMLSLGQQGCMSSRLVFVVGEDASDAAHRAAMLSSLNHACREFWGGPLSDSERVALDHEDWRLCRVAGLTMMPRQSFDDRLFPAWEWIAEEGEPMREAPFSDQAQVLSVVWAPGILWQRMSDIVSWATARPAWKYFSASESLLPTFAELSLPAMPLGRANAPRWDGTHEGHPIFVV